MKLDQTQRDVEPLSLDQNLASERDVDLLERTVDVDTETPLLTPGKSQK